MDVFVAVEAAADARADLVTASVAASTEEAEATAAAALAAAVQSALTLPDRANESAELAESQVATAQAAMDAVDLDDPEALAAVTESLAAANDFLAAAETAVENFGDRDAYVEALMDSADDAASSAEEATAASDLATAAAVDAAPADESARVVVFNPSAGAVITEGGELVVESSFTATGGMQIEVPANGEAYIAAASEADQAAAEVDEKGGELQDALVAVQVATLATIGDDSPEAQAELEEAQEMAAEAQEAVEEAQLAADDAVAARQAEAATVEVSADGTQQSIRDTEGNSATAVTSDTGVVITMAAATLNSALGNLTDGELQPVLASDGSELIATRTADGVIELFQADGSAAVDENGEPYTADALTAMVLIFALG